MRNVGHKLKNENQNKMLKKIKKDDYKDKLKVWKKIFRGFFRKQSNMRASSTGVGPQQTICQISNWNNNSTLEIYMYIV